MKRLTIEDLGFYEMSSEESKEVNGGMYWLIIAAATYFVTESATNPTSSAKALQAGYEAGSK